MLTVTPSIEILAFVAEPRRRSVEMGVQRSKRKSTLEMTLSLENSSQQRNESQR